MRDNWPQECVAAGRPEATIWADETGIYHSDGDLLYPIEDGIVIVSRPTERKNLAAVQFFDGVRWKIFRPLERLVLLLNGGERKARNEYLRHLPDLHGKRLLNVAIGDGQEMPLVPEDCEVYGIDISMTQMRVCHERFGHRRMRLFQAEAEALPFRDHAFDHVVCSGGFNHFGRPEQALREMVRVTRPGGTIVIFDELPDFTQPLQSRAWGRRLMDVLFGAAFSEVIQEAASMDLESMVDGILADWQIHPVLRAQAYCIVGRAPGGDAAAASQTPA